MKKLQDERTGTPMTTMATALSGSATLALGAALLLPEASTTTVVVAGVLGAVIAGLMAYRVDQAHS